MAALLGDDHEFSREILDEVKKARPDATAGDVALTLVEFKSLMLKEKASDANAAERRRRKHEHVSTGGAVEAI